MHILLLRISVATNSRLLSEFGEYEWLYNSAIPQDTTHHGTNWSSRWTASAVFIAAVKIGVLNESKVTTTWRSYYSTWRKVGWVACDTVATTRKRMVKRFPCATFSVMFYENPTHAGRRSERDSQIATVSMRRRTIPTAAVVSRSRYCRSGVLDCLRFRSTSFWLWRQNYVH